MRKSNKKTDRFTGILIDRDAWDNPEHPEYACSFCNRTLVRLSNNGDKNESWFCRACQIPFEPSEKPIRKKSKLGMQRNEVEPAVTSIQTDQSKSVEIRHEPELRGGFAALAKKGTIRFTSYNTSEK
jgi:ribosomal protein L37AE/L43A